MTDFRGASATAASGLTETLEDALSGDSGERASTVSSDLFSMSSTIRGESGLRRFLTDATMPAEGKAGLVRQIFGERADDTSLDVLGEAVGHRWTAGRDLPDALEHLGVVAVVKSAGDRSGQLADELFAYTRLVKDNSQLRDALSDPARSLGDKRSLVASLLQGKALPATVALAGQAMSGSHRTVLVALEEYQKVAAEVFDQRVATVRVAQSLPDDELSRLTDVLSKQYGRRVHVNVLVDPSVLGGVRVEIGDDVIDGTVSARLDEARRRMAGSAAR